MSNKSTYFTAYLPKGSDFSKLQNALIFTYVNSQGEGELWMNTFQSTGVNIVAPIKNG